MEQTAQALAPTREVFVNIQPWMRTAFYVLVLSSMGVLGWRVWVRSRLWELGRAGGYEKDWRLWIRRIGIYALAQKKVHQKSLGGVLHAFLFSGFVVLTIGTTLLAIADQGPVNFHRGWYYLIYELTMDVFGVVLSVGCGLALYRRLFARPAGLGHQASDWGVIAILFSLAITGFLIEALRLKFTHVDASIARWSIVGHGIERLMLAGMSDDAARGWHLGLWWLHAFLVAGFFLAIPVTRLTHIITAPINIAVRPERHAGTLVPVDLAEVEKTGRVGVASFLEFTGQQLMSLDACMECGRCERSCPAWETGKPLSPKALILDLRAGLSRASGPAAPLHGEVIKAETLWSCTMCQACVEECPVLIGHVDLISDMRRHLVAEGELAGPPAKALAALGRQGNPHGRPARERSAWAAGLDVPTVTSNPGFEVLLWVGCAASFDPRAQKVARALVSLFREAGVNFAILGDEEKCTGDPARRMGDELLFVESARGNVETLNRHKVRKVVTPCPHCFNTLGNEYPAFDGHYEVEHHTQFLAGLIAGGRISRGAAIDEEVTLHDPCYLARVNREVDAPRSILALASLRPLKEMPRHGTKTFCCGAGGGRMWADEPPAQRPSGVRAREAVATGASTVATGCPFCLNMMSDAIASAPGGEAVKVRDVAEILAESMVPGSGAAPTTRTGS